MPKPLLPLIIILSTIFNLSNSIYNPFSHEPPSSPSSQSLFQYTSQTLSRSTDPNGNQLFTVQADFGKVSPSDSSDNPDSVQTNTFIISLYTSYNLLGGSCPGFASSTCQSTFGCKSLSENTGNISLPYASLTGTTGETGFYFDYSSFYNSQTPFVFPQTCSGDFTKVTANQDQAITGMIGMGINGSARTSFQGDFPIFSIYFASGGTYGQIIFGLDPHIIDDTFTSVAFPASDDWAISLVNSTVVFGNNNTDFNGTVIFDLNLNSIGMPESLYNDIMGWLATEYDVSCAGLVCTFQGGLSSLPDLNISTSYGDLILTPSVYMTYEGSSSGVSTYSLQFTKLVSNASDDSEGDDVLVNEGYENYIILGYPFISNYYVAFQLHSNGPAVHLFKATQKNDLVWIIIIACLSICAIIVIMLIIGIILNKNRPNRRNRNRRNQENSEDVEESEQLDNQQPDNEQPYVPIVEDNL